MSECSVVEAPTEDPFSKGKSEKKNKNKEVYHGRKIQVLTTVGLNVNRR